MNVSVYLFGEFKSGYTQYPDDFTTSIYRHFSANAKFTTQIAIHRDGNLMYYGYIHKLQQNRYIGLCAVLNGLLLKNIDILFDLFENTICKLVDKGILIHFNAQGELVTNVEKIYLNKEDIDNITETLSSGFNRFESNCIPLPSISYGTSKDSSKDFDADDAQDEIIKSSYTNGYTYVYKSDNYNTTRLNSYKNVLAKSYKEKQELEGKLEVLQKEYAKTLRQKKQFKIVLVLFLFLLSCTVGLFTLNDNLSRTRDALSNAKNTISAQSDSINIRDIEISSLRKVNNELDIRRQEEENKKIKAETNYAKFHDLIYNRQPIIVRGTHFNFVSGYLTVEYYGLTDESLNIKFRAYNDSGESVIQSSSVHIYEGDNSLKVYISDSLKKDKWYSFEILCGNVIVGGDRH